MNRAANDQEQARIEALAESCFAREDDGAVQDWARVWVNTPDGPLEWNVEPTDRCAACGSHFVEATVWVAH
jgi:hypothetical protein